MPAMQRDGTWAGVRDMGSTAGAGVNGESTGSAPLLCVLPRRSRQPALSVTRSVLGSNSGRWRRLMEKAAERISETGCGCPRTGSALLSKLVKNTLAVLLVRGKRVAENRQD